MGRPEHDLREYVLGGLEQERDVTARLIRILKRR
jgi:hypothetical protein